MTPKSKFFFNLEMIHCWFSTLFDQMWTEIWAEENKILSSKIYLEEIHHVCTAFWNYNDLLKFCLCNLIHLPTQHIWNFTFKFQESYEM